MAITFQMHEISMRLPGRVRLKAWVRRILKNEGKKEGAISFVFTTDSRLHEMNVEFLSHDTYTDIITFDQSEGQVISGDIVISRDRVKENAATYGSDFAEELRRVMIHGILHLCGYKDKTDQERQVMRAREDESLRVFKGME